MGKRPLIHRRRTKIPGPDKTMYLYPAYTATNISLNPIILALKLTQNSIAHVLPVFYRKQHKPDKLIRKYHQSV